MGHGSGGTIRPAGISGISAHRLFGKGGGLRRSSVWAATIYRARAAGCSMSATRNALVGNPASRRRFNIRCLNARPSRKNVKYDTRFAPLARQSLTDEYRCRLVMGDKSPRETRVENPLYRYLTVISKLRLGILDAGRRL